MTGAARDNTPFLEPVPQSARATGNGFKCTACGKAETNVKDTRPTHFGPHRVIRRRRFCKRCRTRFTTVEIEIGVLESYAGCDPMEMSRAVEAVEYVVQQLGIVHRRKPVPPK